MVNEKYIISAIIPCYNVEKYIDRCLSSVVQQSIGMEHMQIILVNDASTDNTLEKLLLWETRYSDNILVITYEQNIRQGGARNIGLNYATGDYIGFVDSDDWIEPDMYEVLVEKMLEGVYDVVNCQLIRDKGNDEEANFQPEWGGIVTGLYDRELIYGHNIVFPENVSYEDNYWGSLIKHYVKNSYRIERPLYHYFINQNSTVTSRNSISQLDRMDMETLLLDEYIKRGFFEKDNEQIFDEFLTRYFLNTWFIIFTRFDDVPNVLEEMIDTIFKYFPDYKDRIAKKSFSYRSKLLIDMPLKPEENDITLVKINWLRSWLKDQGVEI